LALKAHNIKDAVMENEKDGKKGWLKSGLILLGVVVIVFLLGYAFKSLFKNNAQPKRQITTIKLLPDTPPPPPPPPPKEQPKEQPKEVQKAPEPKPVDTPPAETLKMEGAAGDGPSPFQSGNVTNDYKGTIGSDASLKFSYYASVIKSEIQKAIQKNPALTDGSYKVVVSVWVKANGDIDRLQVLKSDASPEIEQMIRVALESLMSIKQAPPDGMPQPVKLSITAKKMG
jgi:outer membrane biosynthesis protein TonB